MSSAVIKAAQKFFQSGHAYVHKKTGYVNGAIRGHGVTSQMVTHGSP